jgi:general stress protein YciG
MKGGGIFMDNNRERGMGSDDQEARERASKEGGRTASQDGEHMSEIGRKGGKTVSQDREHMSEIGKKGGQSSHSGGRSSNE